MNHLRPWNSWLLKRKDYIRQAHCATSPLWCHTTSQWEGRSRVDCRPPPSGWIQRRADLRGNQPWHVGRSEGTERHEGGDAGGAEEHGSQSDGERARWMTWRLSWMSPRCRWRSCRKRTVVQTSYYLPVESWSKFLLRVWCTKNNLSNWERK